MSADDIVLLEIWLAFIPATMFVVLYPILSRHLFREWIGRALVASSLGLALLLGLSLLSMYTHREYLHRDIIRISVLAVVVLGANFKLIALLQSKVAAYREERERFRAWRRDDDDRFEDAAES